jgi:pimeloyl-ACP methyl ester carboxylesterase
MEALEPVAPEGSAVSIMLQHRTYIAGEGRDWVVFVHGAGGSSAVWHKQIREFSQHFNVLLVDLRGHGDSARGGIHASSPYTFEDLAAEILDVMDHLNIHSAHFVGVSLGTILIRAIGNSAPERVRSMIMAGAITRLNYRSRFLVRVGTAVRHLVPFLWLYRLFAWIIMPRKRHAEARLLFVREARKLAQQEFMRWWKLTRDVNPLLRVFEEREPAIPTLYVMGDEDHMFLPAVRRLVRRHLSSSRLRVLEDSGHVVNVDRADAFNQVVIHFIKSGRPALARAAGAE